MKGQSMKAAPAKGPMKGLAKGKPLKRPAAASAAIPLKRPAAASGDKFFENFLEKQMAGVWRELRIDASELSRNAASSRGNDWVLREGKRQGITGEQLGLLARGAAKRARDIWDAA